MQTKINKFFKKTKSLPLDLFLEKVLYDKNFGYYQKKNPFGKKVILLLHRISQKSFVK